MNLQQRLLFQAAIREQTSRITDHVAAIVTLQENRFHLSRWIAVILALLFTSCASLTPERIAVLTAIATQAAQLGAQDWLKAHPEQRAAFQAVIDAINAALRAGDVTKAIAMLHSLPVTSLSSKDGEVYWTGEPRRTNAENAIVEAATVGTLVIWDGELKRAVRVTGAAEKLVVMGVRDGLRRAVAPMPPPLPKRNRQPGIAPEGTPTPTPLPRFQPAVEQPAKSDAELDAEFTAVKSKLVQTNAGLRILPAPPPIDTNVSGFTVPVALGRTNVTRSVLDVQTHAGSVPVVTVRWRLAPGGIYHVQQRESELATNWWTFATITNLSRASSTNWSVPWPPGVQTGLWRVMRVR